MVADLLGRVIFGIGTILRPSVEAELFEHLRYMLRCAWYGTLDFLAVNSRGALSSGGRKKKEAAICRNHQHLPGILGNSAAWLRYNATRFRFINGTESHGFGPT